MNINKLESYNDSDSIPLKFNGPQSEKCCSQVNIDEYVVNCRANLKLSARRMIGNRIRERIDSSDLVQETLLVTVSKFSDILDKPYSMIYFWMLGVMKHRIQHHARDIHNHGIPNPLSPMICDLKTEEMSGDLVLAELRSCLIEKLNEMTAIEKEIFQMRYFESLTLHEICQNTGKSEPAVRGILYRTMLKLKHSLHHLVE